MLAVLLILVTASSFPDTDAAPIDDGDHNAMGFEATTPLPTWCSEDEVEMLEAKYDDCADLATGDKLALFLDKGHFDAVSYFQLQCEMRKIQEQTCLHILQACFEQQVIRDITHRHNKLMEDIAAQSNITLHEIDCYKSR